ncbi:MAG TPA: enoyl-CoA hydratase/isomerase family protein [Stellaceae bacterium]|nr:enoyl-CoA hydratase/isomerase family protein [Stellaceae bacterium]
MLKTQSEIRGAAAVIAFENPPQGFMTHRGAAELLRLATEAVSDPAVRALILTGSQPGVFVRHYDIASIARGAEALKTGKATIEDFARFPFTELTDLCASADKPVIAAINGVCMGGGFELALACDIRIAGASVTQIGLPEILADIFPGGGGTQRLPRLIGEARALDFVLRGRVVDAATALSLGLVHEIAADPLEAAVALAATLSTRSPLALSTIKHLVRAAADRPIADGLGEERSAFARLLRDDPNLATDLARFAEADGDLATRLR